jgi:hypothetical protein
MSQEQRDSGYPTAPLSKNTEPDSKLDISKKIDLLAEQKDTGPSAFSAAQLEARLDSEKTERKIERFF